jgi:sigma-B regulation protein RsbU (phosphoserine phosphatase)
MFGWSEEEIFGYRLSETIIPYRYREAHQKGLERFLETGEGPVLGRRVEMQGLRRNGEEFPVELSIMPLQVGSKWLFTASCGTSPPSSGRKSGSGRCSG